LSAIVLRDMAPGFPPNDTEDLLIDNVESPTKRRGTELSSSVRSAMLPDVRNVSVS
jgi:hypothetical protein